MKLYHREAIVHLERAVDLVEVVQRHAAADPEQACRESGDCAGEEVQDDFSHWLRSLCFNAKAPGRRERKGIKCFVGAASAAKSVY